MTGKGWAVALCSMLAAMPAFASNTEATVMVARGAGAPSAAYRQYSSVPGLPVTMSIRGGLMMAPRGAGLAGVDIAVPGISLMEGWEGRIDGDVIFKANLAGIKTVVPVTFNLIHYTSDVAGRSLYYGAGAGALLGGNTKMVGKVLVGVELGSRLGVEGNVHLTSDKALVTVVGRLHL